MGGESRTFANPLVLYYIANWLWMHRLRLAARSLELGLFLMVGARVPAEARLGPRCRLGHGGNGVVIHRLALVGAGVMICQQVTIGGAARSPALPSIGNDVYLGAGCKVLGDVSVGGDSVIGANAVVTKSVPPGSVVVGNPGRIIRTGVRARDVEEW